ncbi:PrsW family intramembrane metalloprotease [Pontimonas sp.]|uniref:PrsW family intramembrane metalloprotease n=1 Tax=Pontimonas sp. TaxID=2304492 RepID=UPI0028708DE9|nr:PrsW family intramembrane metalloprotease [Pontimonas sp.]MDR9396039.1 PrsW family intramembrane metalloprotease [Pontimonas sp.]
MSAASGSRGARSPFVRTLGIGALVILGFVLVGVATLIALDTLAGSLGGPLLVISALVALVPLAIVAWGIRWIDRFEPEPPAATWFAFLFGAGVAVVIALGVDAWVWTTSALAGSPEGLSAVLGPTVQAPLVEEFGKGLAVWVLFWVGRNRLDGPIDGVVYAAWSAAGFAFSENILYFGAAIAQGGDVFVETFIVRGLMSPFAHVMFTALIGYSLGRAAEKGVRGLGLWAFTRGFIPAVLLHALWNGALFVVSSFYVYFFVVQVPLFVGAVLMVGWLRNQKAAILRENLGYYARAGVIADQEMGFLTTAAGRVIALRWAKKRGLGKQLDRFIAIAVRLALTRHREERGIHRGADDWETTLVGELVDARDRLHFG